MENRKKIDELASKSLGSSNSYAVYTDHYDKSLLNPLPRELSRDEKWQIDPTNIIGYDVWRCWESTFLTKSGLPVAGTLKIVYPANSPNIVESKSFKVFLNSFDQMRLGTGTIESAINEYVGLVTECISEAVGAKAEIKFFETQTDREVVDFQSHYRDLVQAIPNVEELEFSDYEGKGYHLQTSPLSEGEYVRRFSTDILRSRCQISLQKDSGSAFVTIVTKNCEVDPASLLKQIVSMREMSKFHEPCCEKLYSELMQTPGVIDCAVMLLYVRRGSLDINPIRASKPELLTKELIDIDIFTQKTQAQ